MKIELNKSSQRQQRKRWRTLPEVRLPNSSFSLRALCVLLLLLLSCPPASAIEAVRATVEKDEAWTGEDVPLIITLYSPGPFSGTASFDLPELPKTAFVKVGNPLVGSEEVDGESYLTQRHEFKIYTQQSGEIVIPAFSIRFSGKKTFTSDPEPMEGATQELRFQSKRPPGTESMGVVVSVSEMKIEQTWQPQSPTEVTAGDVIQRTITRTAEDTTAMMFPAVVASTPDGVRIYDQQPIVEDKTERGEATAYRSDTIKYQFQHPGTFTLPDMTFIWWDPQKEKLQHQSLPGLTIAVVEESATVSPASEQKSERSSAWMFALIGLLAVGLFAWLIRKPVLWLIGKWRAHHNRPEALAVRKLRAACKSNDASAAYAALLSWASIQRTNVGCDRLESCFEAEEYCGLREQWQALSRHLFASESVTTAWQGRRLWIAFSRSQSRPNRELGRKPSSALPELNPSARARG